jgi:osmoprotectant transport system substrate-binding protein
MTIRRLSLAAGTAVAALALAACGSSSSSGSGSSPSTSSAPSTSTVASSSTPSVSTPAVSSSAPSTPATNQTIVIGAANFGENEILANLYAIALQKAGYKTKVKTVGAREIAEPALEKGSTGGGVDILPEYLATDTEYFNKLKNGANATAVASGDVDKTLAAGQPLANGYGVTFLTPSPAQDTNAFAVTAKFAKANGLTTLSDLATKYKGTLILGGPSECPTRPYCEPGLEHTYGLKFSKFKALDSGGPLTKAAIAQGSVTIGLVFSSDGGIAANGLQVLLDDKHLQNADNVVAAVNTKLAGDAALAAALNAVDAALTTDDLVTLNKSVDVDHKDPAAVAKAFADAHGLS